jgi:hypothetical protein
VTCAFACDCTTDVGQCTFIGMRVLVCFWIFLRLIVLLLNIALLFDKKNGWVLASPARARTHARSLALT